MSPAALLIFVAMATATSFIAGIFGMAGGMLLMGGLLYLMPVGDAMILHGITQMTSNGWRAFLWRRYIRWSIAGRYLLGLVVAGALFSSLHIVPHAALVFLLLGLLPFVGRALPSRVVPPVSERWGAELAGFVSTSFQLLAGVSGPLLDIFFIRSPLDRRTIVATKAACQVMSHLSKLIYFSFVVRTVTTGVVTPLVVALAIMAAATGTTLGRTVLERLTDASFRRYTWWLLYAIGTIYLAKAAFAVL